MNLIKPTYTRKIINFLGLGFCTVSTIFVLFLLLWILLTLIYQGLHSFQFSIFTELTPPPHQPGGLANALWGSFLMTTFAILVATPIGILAGVYFSEYASSSRFTIVSRFVNDVLLSAPSIIIGLFIYEIYVRYMGHFSGWAGVMALAIIALPLIVRTTDDLLGLVPMNLREASAALGAPPYLTITKIVFRVARRGIITGILLAVARISGETAPLLFTALNNQFFSSNLNQPLANMPITIYKFALSPYSNWQLLAWQGSLIVTVWVLFCNITVKILFMRKLTNLKRGH